jgi:hypothetical protein
MSRDFDLECICAGLKCLVAEVMGLKGMGVLSKELALSNLNKELYIAHIEGLNALVHFQAKANAVI